MNFRWDERKNETNKRKHGVAFETAVKAFDDPSYMLFRDRVDEEGEQRWHAVGVVGHTVLLVVHVYRKEEEQTNVEEITRVISAREASNRERRIYFRQASE